MSANTLAHAVSPRVEQRLFRTRPEDALPHTATHHRVYIVPSRRGVAFLFALLLMLIASVNYALSLGYALSFLLTGLFAASLLHTYKNLAGLEVHAIDVENGFCGDAVTFRFALHNSASDTRHGICVRTPHGTTPMTAIAAGDTATATLSVPARSRGRVRLGRMTLQSNWPVGLWTCWSYLHVPAEALVYPQPEANPPPLPSQQTEESGDTRVASLDGEIAGVRDYRPGDPLSAIAWKSAAKGAGLHVRTFESSQSPATVELSLTATGQAHLEDQLSRLTAWVERAHTSHTEFSLELPGERHARDRGEHHRLRSLTTLALYGLPT
ncbi:MAG: DUF58 domain-containing protein [Pseudomonadota bacterium]